MAAAKRLSRALVDAYSPDGVLLYQNNGVGSGQEVPHFHLHVLPRQPESDWGLGPPHLERLEREARLRHQDHLVETGEKRQTAAKMRVPVQPLLPESDGSSRLKYDFRSRPEVAIRNGYLGSRTRLYVT